MRRDILKIHTNQQHPGLPYREVGIPSIGDLFGKAKKRPLCEDGKETSERTVDSIIEHIEPPAETSTSTQSTSAPEGEHPGRQLQEIDKKLDTIIKELATCKPFAVESIETTTFKPFAAESKETTTFKPFAAE